MSAIVRAFKDLIYLGLEQFGRYYSVYRGFVADRDDPENLNRVRLVIPEIAGTNVYDYWAFPKHLYSGEGYGMQHIPENGDMVWVEFEKGHPNKPIWSMGYRANGELPNEVDVEDKSCFWFITPKGHVIKINDTKNYIHIKTQQGDYVELNSDSISLVTEKKISLGQLNESAEPAVLGNKNEEALRAIHGCLNNFIERVQTGITASNAIPSPFLSKAALEAGLTSLKNQLQEIEDKIPPTKSQKVTLD